MSTISSMLAGSISLCIDDSILPAPPTAPADPPPPPPSPARPADPPARPPSPLPATPNAKAPASTPPGAPTRKACHVARTQAKPYKQPYNQPYKKAAANAEARDKLADGITDWQNETCVAILKAGKAGDVFQVKWQKLDKEWTTREMQKLEDDEKKDGYFLMKDMAKKAIRMVRKGGLSLAEWQRCEEIVDEHM